MDTHVKAGCHNVPATGPAGTSQASAAPLRQSPATASRTLTAASSSFFIMFTYGTAAQFCARAAGSAPLQCAPSTRSCADRLHNWTLGISYLHMSFTCIPMKCWSGVIKDLTSGRACTRGVGAHLPQRGAHDGMRPHLQQHRILRNRGARLTEQHTRLEALDLLPKQRRNVGGPVNGLSSYGQRSLDC